MKRIYGLFRIIATKWPDIEQINKDVLDRREIAAKWAAQDAEDEAAKAA
jgi:hypothetical protein